MLMNTPISDQVPALTAPPSHLRPAAGGAWLRLIGTWMERRRQRRALAELDDHQLRDIGLTRAEARAECAQPFWR